MTARERDHQRRTILGLFRLLSVLLIVVITAGCATGKPASPEAPATAAADDNDPLEPMNRAIFAVNQAVDKAVIRPVSLVYRDYVPTVVQDRVRDFLRNLRTPLIFVNNVLQGDWEGAEVSVTRFFVNSTLGVGGLVDIANYGRQGEHGYPFKEADFGQTLGVWGVGEGPYLVLPLLGPSNVRDATGFAVDFVGDPVGIAIGTGDTGAKNFGYTTTGLNIPDRRAPTIEATDELERSSVDYYATLRSLYRRSREATIRGGKAEPEVIIPEYEELNPSPTGVTPSP